jgi:hypothetical protein
VWQAPAIEQVESLENFSLVVLVSGTPQTTRAWIEQAQTVAPHLPMIAVVSAAAEPLARPYLQAPANVDAATDPNDMQLDGLIVGLPGGAALEAKLNQPGAGLAEWPGLGGGLLAAAAIILAGSVIFGLLGLIRRRS